MSRALHIGVHHLLVPGDIEMNGEFVVLDRSYRAVSEFLVEYPGADRKAADLAYFLASPRRRAAAGGQRSARRGGGLPWRLDRAAPAGIPGGAGLQAELGYHLDMIGRQLVDKAGADCILPLAVDAPIGRK